jgi:circadian clock protein KaiC
MDAILNGGFVKGGVYLLLGPPGVGKTILANQICFHHAKNQKSNIVYVTLLAESHGRMMENLSSLKYFQEEKVSDSIHYMGGYHILEKEGLKGFLRMIAGIVKEKGASILMIDGMSTIGELEQSAITFRKFAHELNSYLSASGCTAFLLSSMEGHLSKPEHTMVDGIISFHYENVNSRVVRQLEVRKFRGSDHFYGKHFYRIDSNGIEIFPRLESMPVDQNFHAYPQKRTTTGVKSLDAMMGGGICFNSLTTLLGSAGTGKTSLSLQFLAAGAKAGEKGLFFGFYENPEELVCKADVLSINLRSAVKKKMIEFNWQPPLELNLDELAGRLLKAIEQTGAKRLVIDGMDGFKNSVSDKFRMNQFMPALIMKLKSMQVTTFLIEEISTFGNYEGRQVAELSAINENVILLHHEDIDDDIMSAVTILKMRNSNFDKSTRKLILSDKGISVEGKVLAPEILPTNKVPVIEKGTSVKRLGEKKKSFFKGRR